MMDVNAETIDAWLPGAWRMVTVHFSEYVEAKRGNESAMFHLHHRGGYGMPNPKTPTAHFCTWMGRDVKREACGNGLRLPEPQPGDRA